MPLTHCSEHLMHHAVWKKREIAPRTRSGPCGTWWTPCKAKSTSSLTPSFGSKKSNGSCVHCLTPAPSLPSPSSSLFSLLSTLSSLRSPPCISSLHLLPAFSSLHSPPSTLLLHSPPSSLLPIEPEETVVCCHVHFQSSDCYETITCVSCSEPANADACMSIPVTIHVTCRVLIV